MFKNVPSRFMKKRLQCKNEKGFNINLGLDFDITKKLIVENND